MSDWSKFEDYVHVLLGMVPLDVETQSIVQVALDDHRRRLMEIAYSRETWQFRSTMLTDVNCQLIDRLEELAGIDDAGDVEELP